jgi:uncharacterized repeat protein (TIGR02543 family)
MDQQPEKRELRGLYKHVKIPVKVLDIVIVVCVLAIVVVLAIELQDPGYTITFDTKGGTDVPAQTQMYGELLAVPESPTREGYAFTGWYKDHGCLDLWDVAQDIIEMDITLYAGWEKLE